MRASTAVGLLFASSMSIFGLYGRHRTNAALPPGPEPVWLNGQMGVYNPDTREFVASTSPLFDETCDLIQLCREQALGSNTSSGSSWSYGNHWNYFSGAHFYSSSSGGMSELRSGSSFGSHTGSMRGGIGATGHSFGGSHA